MTFATASFSPSSAWTLALLGMLAASAALPARAHAQSAVELRPYTPSARPVVDPVAPPSVVHAAPARPLVTRSWYGYQLMATDAASIGLLFAGPAAPLGGITFFGAPPAIHGLHGNARMAIASPAMRIGLPLVGMVLGSSAERCERNPDSDFDMCGLGGAMVGGGIGLLAAMVVDYALAWQVTAAAPVAASAPPAAPRGAGGLRVSSAGLAPLNGGAALMVGGQF